MPDANAIIAMERAALDRWGAGDPQGYLEIMAPEVTYFDPVQERRIDGLPAITAMLQSWTGKIKVDRYDMVSPMVQQRGERMGPSTPSPTGTPPRCMPASTLAGASSTATGRS